MQLVGPHGNKGCEWEAEPMKGSMLSILNYRDLPMHRSSHLKLVCFLLLFSSSLVVIHSHALACGNSPVLVFQSAANIHSRTQ